MSYKMQRQGKAQNRVQVSMQTCSNSCAVSLRYHFPMLCWGTCGQPQVLAFQQANA